MCLKCTVHSCPASILCQRSSSCKNVCQPLLILPPTFVKELLITRVAGHTSAYAAEVQQRKPFLCPVAQVHFLERLVRTDPQENLASPTRNKLTNFMQTGGGRSVGGSPESKPEIHKLAVFELEVIVQLLNDHSVRLSHLLLPLIFTGTVKTIDSYYYCTTSTMNQMKRSPVIQLNRSFANIQTSLDSFPFKAHDRLQAGTPWLPVHVWDGLVL